MLEGKSPGSESGAQGVDSPRASSGVSRARLEFLFDGVFAIAMTILVLDLRVPELEDPRSARALLAGVAHEAPAFLGYLISFVILGVLWHNHQRHYRHIRRISRGVLVANLGLLFSAAAFPFCAALFSRYPVNPFSVVFYLGCLFLHTSFSYLQWRWAERGRDLDPDLAPAEARKIRMKILRGIVVLGAMTVVYTILALTKL